METVQKIIGKKMVVHLTFCLTVAGCFLYTVSLGFNLIGVPQSQAIYVHLLFYGFFYGCIYTGRWLCRWYLRNQPVRFLLYTLLASIGILVIRWALLRLVFAPYAGFLEATLNHGLLFLIGLVMGILLKLIRASMQNQVREAQITAEQRQSELNLLQSQLSPHFLFNTLNNMYGISITQQERIPDLLLKLSDLLRYSVYDTKKPFVPLTEELEYIRNYIDFEKIRIGSRLVLQTDMAPVPTTDITIAPMVLVVFIENAFKHARNTLEQKIYIDLSLKISDNYIFFAIKNSHKPGADKKNGIKESSGLGLVNAIKRLELLYGNGFELKQDDKNNFYTVTLRLPIKK